LSDLYGNDSLLIEVTTLYIALPFIQFHYILSNKLVRCPTAFIPDKCRPIKHRFLQHDSKLATQ